MTAQMRSLKYEAPEVTKLLREKLKLVIRGISLQSPGYPLKMNTSQTSVISQQALSESTPEGFSLSQCTLIVTDGFLSQGQALTEMSRTDIHCE